MITRDDIVITKNGKIGIVVYIIEETTDKYLVVFDDKTHDRYSEDELILYTKERA